MKKTYVIISSILSIVMIWYLLFVVIGEPLLMPSFHDVLISLFHMIFSNQIVITLLSLLRLFIGFLIAAILGIVFGFISAKNEWAEIFQRPYVTILRTIPVLSVVVILFILIGSDIAVYVIVFLMIFPLFYQSTLNIIKNIDKSLLDVLRMNEGHLRESIKYVYYPILKEGLFVTIFQSLGLGVKVLVMAEYLMQTKHSIGQSIYVAKVNLMYADVYAWTFVLIMMTILLEMIVHHIQKKQM
ncbi:MAG: ABC transporter permease [Acholeplasmataceae bacterium]